MCLYVDVKTARKKPYYDILLVTENIKVATKRTSTSNNKKEYGNYQLHETGFRFVNSICSTIRGFLLSSRSRFQLILSCDQVLLCISISLFHHTHPHTYRKRDRERDGNTHINNMSAAEYENNNGEIEHYMCVAGLTPN